MLPGLDLENLGYPVKESGEIEYKCQGQAPAVDRNPISRAATRESFL